MTGRVNLPIAALSLASATLIWLVAFGQNAKPAVTRTYAVRLTPDGLKEGRWALTKIPETITLSVTAPEERLMKLNPDTFVAYADLSKATAGARNYPVRVFPSSLRGLLANPTLSVPAELEAIASRRVKVVIDTKGELNDPSLTLQSLLTEPQEATVTGPSSQVESVRRVRGFLDLGNVAFGPGESANVALEPLDANGRALERVRSEPLFARVRLGVTAAPEEKQVLIVPNFRGAPAAGYVPASYTLVPTQLAVRGKSMTLAGFSKAPTDPIDLAGLTADRTFDVAVRLPEGARSVGPARVRVTVRVARLPAAPAPSPSPGSSSGPSSTQAGETLGR